MVNMYGKQKEEDVERRTVKEVDLRETLKSNNFKTNTKFGIYGGGRTSNRSRKFGVNYRGAKLECTVRPIQIEYLD